MREILKRATKVEIRKSPVHGYGVFCLEDIKKGEIIEECIFFEPEDPNYHVLDKNLIRYCWAIPYLNPIALEIAESEEVVPEFVLSRPIFASGIAMALNHSFKPNASWEYVEGVRTLFIRACAPIKAGEEIFIKYSDDVKFENV